MNKIVKKILIIVIIIFVVIIGYVELKIFINKRFIKNYPDTQQEYRLMLLSMINLYEPYIAPYNYGNYLYKQERYEEAEKKYLKALSYDIPKKRICDVEINLGLTYMKISDGKDIDESIVMLEKARDHFNNCANLDLSKEIEEEKKKKEEEEKKKQEEEEKSGQNNNNGGQQGSSGQNGQQGNQSDKNGQDS